MDPFIGEIRAFPYNYAPYGWLECNGQMLSVDDFTLLFSLIYNQFGGDGRTTFALPNLRGFAAMHTGHGPGLSNRYYGMYGGSKTAMLQYSTFPAHSHSMSTATVKVACTTGPADATSPVDGVEAANADSGDPSRFLDKTPTATMKAGIIDVSGGTGGSGSNVNHENLMPFQTMGYFIATDGIYPSDGSASDSFTGEIRLLPRPRNLSNWVPCDGQTFSIQEYTPLFSLIGTTYGGDGRATFKLPDMRSRIPISYGSRPGSPVRQCGAMGGAENVVLTEQTIPGHTHPLGSNAEVELKCSSSPATSPDPAGMVSAPSPEGSNDPARYQTFITTDGTKTMMNTIGALSGDTDISGGLNGAHYNMSPYFVLSYYICMKGIYPEFT